MSAIDLSILKGESIRVRGQVQGVGFRPTVWRLARDCTLCGDVCNDSEGVLIRVWGSAAAVDDFVRRLQNEPPPLARIDSIERSSITARDIPSDFSISESVAGEVQTGVVPDAATCPDCLREILDPENRRYRYAFTNCTHCGPRLSIVHSIPYDRSHTSMAPFTQCPACQAEYKNPADRRFHAQPNACPECGPRLWLENSRHEAVDIPGARDAVDTARILIEQGSIVAVKGIGGIHLACDAGNGVAIVKLRQRKRRYQKAFALMARDVTMIRQYAQVNADEQALLESRSAPIVILDAIPGTLPEQLAPSQHTLGFMLPYTPLHHLLMQDMARPVVLTSGNLSDEPQCIENDDARDRLQQIADYWLLNDRDIVNRLDDSVVRFVAGRPQMLRRARGYAPESYPLPEGFEQVPAVLAMGAELKNSFCLLKDGEAILSQHMGDLEDAHTLSDYRHHLDLYRNLFDFRPQFVAVDRHPDYLSTQTGHSLASDAGLEVIEVQHHHAHIASCMAEHGLPIDTPPVLGVALDGLGFGLDETLWGGEFLLADYTGFERLAYFSPVPMPGGTQAMREPWRNTFAQLSTFIGWRNALSEYAELDIIRFLETKPLKTLDAMIKNGINSPPSSSCGRLFDAVAAAIGICREIVTHEGQAAIELESLATPVFDNEANHAYFSDTTRDGSSRQLGWASLWRELLADIQQGTEPAVIAARFHHGLIRAVSDLVAELGERNHVQTVALGGGVFQNRLILEGVSACCREGGFRVIHPERAPANDGGIALGQAVVAVARARKRMVRSL